MVVRLIDRMATEHNEREINVGELPVEQLNGLKTQHENEIRELQGQLETLHGAKNRFIGARATIDDMKTMPEETKLLVPLNGSLYAPGTIASSDKLIVELGTGYFCEKNSEDAKTLIDRKMQLVDKSIESIEQIGNKKRKNLEQIMQIMYAVTPRCCCADATPATPATPVTPATPLHLLPLLPLLPFALTLALAPMHSFSPGARFYPSLSAYLQAI